MDHYFKPRREIIDHLIRGYTIKLLENNYPEKTRFLSQKLNCKCTDCGGKNSFSSCNLEDKFYKKTN
jgi:hypothetical protein